MPSNLHSKYERADFTENSGAVAEPLPEEPNNQIEKNGFNESGQVKKLTDSEKVSLLEGRWNTADLYSYSFPFRFEILYMNHIVIAPALE